MLNSTYFFQQCPTCGRNLQIRVAYLGKKLVCQHCQGQFQACDPANQRCVCAEHDSGLLHRADELLESVAQQKAQQHFPHPR